MRYGKHNSDEKEPSAYKKNAEKPEQSSQKSSSDKPTVRPTSKGYLKAVPLVMLASALFLILCFVTADTGIFGNFIF